MHHASSAGSVPSAATQPTVFIVDNDSAMRRSLAFLLDSLGFATACFETAEEFLDAYTPDQPGCLILDLRLPGMSGLALQARLDELHSELPVIMVTGFGDVDTAVRVLKGGAFDFVEKPVADELLLDRINAALAWDAQRRAQRAERERVARRLARLTARERAVFDEVVRGKANKVVAIEFGISEKTVEAHRARVMHKLGASSLAELVRMDLTARELERPILPYMMAPGAAAARHALV